MIDMYYLNKHEGRAVKKFVVRSTKQIEVALGVVKDQLYVTGGVLIYERKLSDKASFCIVSFEDEIMLATWEFILGSALKDATIVEILCSKVLIIKDNQGVDAEAQTKVEAIKADIHKYDAAILRERKLGNAEYELLLFFTDNEKMTKWENTFLLWE